MSEELYQVIALAGRYLFTLLGGLIALRAFTWIIAEGREKRKRKKDIPDAGNIGELAAVQGGGDIKEGDCFPIPWEGVMGSIRSCDICLPGKGIKKQHLDFSYQAGEGLLILPRSGCEAWINGRLITPRTAERDARMGQGDSLRIGNVLLRLRLFAGLAFEDNEPSQAVMDLNKQEWGYGSPFPAEMAPQVFFPEPGMDRIQPGGITPEAANWAANPAVTVPQEFFPEPPQPEKNTLEAAKWPSSPAEDRTAEPKEPVNPRPAQRRRRSQKWEADWSE